MRNGAGSGAAKAREFHIKPLAPFEPEVEARWGVDVDHSDDGLAAVRERVRDSGRHEHEGAGPGDHLVVVDGEGELALEDVERVVLRSVRVLLRPLAVGLERDQREVEARCVGAPGEESTFPTRCPSPGGTTIARTARSYLDSEHVFV